MEWNTHWFAGKENDPVAIVCKLGHTDSVQGGDST